MVTDRPTTSPTAGATSRASSSSAASKAARRDADTPSASNRDRRPSTALGSTSRRSLRPDAACPAAVLVGLARAAAPTGPTPKRAWVLAQIRPCHDRRFSRHSRGPGHIRGRVVAAGARATRPAPTSLAFLGLDPGLRTACPPGHPAVLSVPMGARQTPGSGRSLSHRCGCASRQGMRGFRYAGV